MITSGQAEICRIQKDLILEIKHEDKGILRWSQTQDTKVKSQVKGREKETVHTLPVLLPEWRYSTASVTDWIPTNLLGSMLTWITVTIQKASYSGKQPNIQDVKASDIWEIQNSMNQWQHLEPRMYCEINFLYCEKAILGQVNWKERFGINKNHC